MEEVYLSDTFMSHISLFFTHLLLLLSHNVKGTLSDSPPATIPPPRVKHIPLGGRNNIEFLCFPQKLVAAGRCRRSHAASQLLQLGFLFLCTSEHFYT